MHAKGCAVLKELPFSENWRPILFSFATGGEGNTLVNFGKCDVWIVSGQHRSTENSKWDFLVCYRGQTIKTGCELRETFEGSFLGLLSIKGFGKLKRRNVGPLQDVSIKNRLILNCYRRKTSEWNMAKTLSVRRPVRDREEMNILISYTTLPRFWNL